MSQNQDRGIKTITVVGLGKLGSPIAACLGAAGFTVIGVDTDQTKVDAVNRAHSPVRETGLDEMIKSAGANLTATTDLRQAVAQSDATLVMVPTPSEADGSFSLSYIASACAQIGQALREQRGYHLVSICSTVMPGDTDGTIRTVLETSSGRRVGKDELGLCYSPEFIALGSVIRDYLHPDMVLIGESDSRAGALLENVYRRVCRKEPAFARMSFVNAELTKIAVNSFITTKITFANMIAGICQNLPGADVDTVSAALGCDSRIGRKYLTGAVAFGGPCFPRDNVALSRVAQRCASSADLARSVHDANGRSIDALADLVRQSLSDTNQVVGVLGLSYKPDTDVIDESPGVHLAARLSEAGLPVIAHDPAANANARQALGQGVRIVDTLHECIHEADVLVITTPWKEFAAIGSLLPAQRRGQRQTIIDCWRCVDVTSLDESTDYIAIGVGRSSAPRCEADIEPGAIPEIRSNRRDDESLRVA